MPIELRELGTEVFLYEQGASGSAAFGSDGTAGEKIKLVTALGITDIDPSSGTIAAGTCSLSIDPSANGDIEFCPKGVGQSTFARGSVEILGDAGTAGNLLMQDTTAGGLAGVIEYGGDRFVHNYGTSNTFIGERAGNFSLTPANSRFNTAVGYNTLNLVGGLGGEGNTAIGASSCDILTTGNENTALGRATLGTLTTGNTNTAIGNLALTNLNSSGSNNTAVGASAGVSLTGTDSNNIIIGEGVTGTIGDNRKIRIGQVSGATSIQSCYIAGIAVASNTPTGVVGVDALGKLAGSNGSNGQIQVGGGTGPVWANITSTGGTVTVSNGANTINLESAVTPGTTWSVITVNQTAAVNNGYICNKGSALDLLLPATSATGTVIEVTGMNTALGWKITQAAGQQIFFGTSSTTVGATGYLQSSNIRDSIKMVCVVADLTWNVISSVGNITIF